HVFTERPIYRPEEPVHIKGYVRSYLGGALSYATRGGTLIVSGPSKQEWLFPVRLDATGNFYHKFDTETPATGDYKVAFKPDVPQLKKVGDDAADNADSERTDTCGETPFKKEAYRLPRSRSCST